MKSDNILHVLFGVY